MSPYEYYVKYQNFLVNDDLCMSIESLFNMLMECIDYDLEL